MRKPTADLDRARRLMAEMGDDTEDQEASDVMKLLRALGCHEEQDEAFATAVFVHEDCPELAFSVNLAYPGVPKRKWRVLRQVAIRFLATAGGSYGRQGAGGR